MKIQLQITKDFDVRYLLVLATVRHWEDAKVDGVKDLDGLLIPCRVNDQWRPLIDLETGQIMNWKAGVTADIHYKVCDEGSYRLLNAAKMATAKCEGAYVPEFLSIGEVGYGDYIILQINTEGFIKDWRAPDLESYVWEPNE